MARSFSQSTTIRTSIHRLLLLRRDTNLNLNLNRDSSYRLVTLRNQSSHSEYPHADPDASSSDAELPVSLQTLEDAIHHIVARRSAPDWIAFRPGSSYWVPPRRYGIAQLLDKLAPANLTREESMSLTTPRGWPSLSYFLNDGQQSPNWTEVKTASSNVPKAEDEEG